MPSLVLHDDGDLPVDCLPSAIVQVSTDGEWRTEGEISAVGNALSGTTWATVILCGAPDTIWRPHEGDRSHFLACFFSMVLSVAGRKERKKCESRIDHRRRIELHLDGQSMDEGAKEGCGQLWVSPVGKCPASYQIR